MQLEESADVRQNPPGDLPRRDPSNFGVGDNAGDNAGDNVVRLRFGGQDGPAAGGRAYGQAWTRLATVKASERRLLSALATLDDGLSSDLATLACALRLEPSEARDLVADLEEAGLVRVTDELPGGLGPERVAPTQAGRRALEAAGTEAAGTEAERCPERCRERSPDGGGKKS